MVLALSFKVSRFAGYCSYRWNERSLNSESVIKVLLKLNQLQEAETELLSLVTHEESNERVCLEALTDMIRQCESIDGLR